MIYKRGSVWWADLGGDVVGSEQNYRRPVVIIQNDIGNEYAPTVIVAALTDVENKYMPTHIEITPDEVPGLPKVSAILMEQIRTVDKKRLKKHIGHVPESKLGAFDYAIGVSVGIIKSPKQKQREAEKREKRKPAY